MRRWRSGSLRQRRPGVWEIRITVATDPLTGRAIQRSFTFRGERADAEARCGELADAYADRRTLIQAAPFITVGEVLARWLEADHDWRPSTWAGYRSTVKALVAEPIAATAVARLTPEVARAVLGQWRQAGVTDAVLAGRFRALRAALGWAAGHELVDRNPLAGMRGPPQPAPRMHVPLSDVVVLLGQAEVELGKARADIDGGRRATRRLHEAEQMLLLVRLAADTGARRGELAALRIEDLDGRVLTIARAVSLEQVGPTKTRQRRRLTVGTSTTVLWHDLVAEWQALLAEGDPVGPWLFSVDPAHRTRASTSYLTHSFAQLCRRAGVPEVTLHRLRHTVATFLVDRGDLLKAQQRLGRRDPSTTLRNYAHAMPLDDVEAADALDAALSTTEPTATQ